MKKIFILCIIFFMHIYLFAQHKIVGKVTDQDNIPLTGTTIYLPELNKGTIADENGNYEISSLPKGKILIQFSYVGYSNRIETVTLSDSNVELNISLKQIFIETEELVITGGYQTTQHQNAVKIEALKIEPLSIKPSPNFAEVLTNIPGVDMISKGSGVSKPVIRGLSKNDILILNNGVRFENYQYSDHHPLGIDEFGIATVEVIKGPASLLYGSDAIGGVMNFIKEKEAPEGTIKGDYNLQLFSNSLGMNNNIGIKGASKNIFGGIRIGHKTNSDYKQGGGDFVPNSRFNEYAVKANIGHSGKIGSFKLLYDYNRQNLGLVEEEAVEEIDKRGRSTDIFYQQLNTHLVASRNKIYFAKMKLDVNTAYQHTELIHFGEKDVHEIQMRLATFTYETKLSLPSGDKTDYIVGFQGIYQTNKNINDRETILLPDATIENYSGFGLFQWQPMKKIKLQAGLRYDHKNLTSDAVGKSNSEDFRNALDKNYGSLSGSVGVTFNATKKILLRLNAASAYRTPNLPELTSKGPHEERYEVGDQHLESEKSFELDASMHYHSDNLTIDIAGFYNYIRDYIFIAPTGKSTNSGLPVYQYSQHNSYLYGGEVGLHFHPMHARWLHLLTTFSSVIGKSTNGDYLPFIPAHKIRPEIKVSKDKLSFLHNPFIALNADIAFKQDNVAPDEMITSGYALFDASTGGNIRINEQPMAIMIGINNIFDKKYVDHLSTLKEVNFYNPGRNISLTLKIPF